MVPSIHNLVSWTVLALLLSSDASHSLRVLGLFPLPGRSHFIVCESLMRNLAMQGHQVDVYSHFPLQETVPNYTDYSLVGSSRILSNNMPFEIVKPLMNTMMISKTMMAFGKPICELMNLPIFQKLLRDSPKYDVIVVELFAANCYLAWGHRLQVPVVAVVTTTLYDWLNEPLGNPFNAAVEPCTFSIFSTPMTFYQRLYNFLQEKLTTWSFDFYLDEQNDVVKQVFGPDYPDIRDMQKDISLTLVNYHYSLNGIRPLLPKIQPIGGIHIEQPQPELPQNVQLFLDESQHGFIYFSFGSMVRIETFPKSVLQIFYATFRKIAPIRVLLKIAKPEELPPELPTNVMTQPWFSQIKVLQHKNVKAFITHGGLLGSQEAIYHGVPMIGIPLFADQYFNIQSYIARNISVMVDINSLTEESFTNAVTEVLNNPIYKKSVKKISKAFKDVPISPADTATYWIKYVVRHGKNALRYPIVDMAWWQKNLLDVYVFILFVIISILYIMRFVLKQLGRKFFVSCDRTSSMKLKRN